MTKNWILMQILATRTSNKACSETDIPASNKFNCEVFPGENE